MRANEYREMKVLEKTYWWHVGRNFIIKCFLDKRFSILSSFHNNLILDVGCGTGGNFPLLKKYGQVIGIDDSTLALSLVEKQHYKKLICGIASAMPFDSFSFDCVVLTDVLEHISDNLELVVLSECLRVLKIGGGLIISVPAYPWLWSGHDEVLNHKRRYMMKEIITKIENSGFKIVQSSYAIFFLAPLIIIYRLIQKLFGSQQKTSYVLCPQPVNFFFITLLRFESFLIKKGLSFPMGTSIFVYAVRCY